MSISATTPPIIDFTTAETFVESEWIGSGKVYDAKIPIFVSDAKKNMFSIPPDFRNLFPDNSLPVIQFLSKKLPVPSSNLVVAKPQLWFSPDMATGKPNGDVLLSRPMPTEHFVLFGLDRIAGQAWLDGAKSILDPRFNDGSDHYPLWVLTFWKTMFYTTKTQLLWQASYKWLQREAEKAKDEGRVNTLITKAFDILNHVPWSARLPHLRGTTNTRELCTFLSNGWLNDNHIDMMIESLLRELDATEKVTIAPCHFATQIVEWATGKGNNQGHGLRHQYQKLVKEKKLHKLFFPVHIQSNHWIGAFVDFVEGKVGYGEN